MLPQLKAAEEEPPTGAPRLVMVSNGDPDATRAHGLASLALYDPGSRLMHAFGVAGTPIGVLVVDGLVASPVAAGADAVLRLYRSGGLRLWGNTGRNRRRRTGGNSRRHWPAPQRWPQACRRWHEQGRDAMSHWLDAPAKRLASGTYSRRRVLRQGGSLAALSLLASVSRPLRALASTPPCSPKTCPEGLCCEGRCLGDHSGFGCCHRTIYFRPGQQCCSEQPRPAGTCAPMTPNVAAQPNAATKASFAAVTRACERRPTRSGAATALPTTSGQRTAAPNNRPRSSSPMSALKDETCCGTTKCCKKGELCCGDTCLRAPADEIGCCNGLTYNLRSEDCCPEQPAEEFKFHVCFKDETCCGTTECRRPGEECCPERGGPACMPKGSCGRPRCSPSGICPDSLACCYQQGVPNSDICCPEPKAGAVALPG